MLTDTDRRTIIAEYTRVGVNLGLPFADARRAAHQIADDQDQENN